MDGLIEKQKTMPDIHESNKREPEIPREESRVPSVPYAELHCKTNFSFLEGASHPDELVARAAELGYQALAITDSHSLAGRGSGARRGKAGELEAFDRRGTPPGRCGTDRTLGKRSGGVWAAVAADHVGKPACRKGRLPVDV